MKLCYYSITHTSFFLSFHSFSLASKHTHSHLPSHLLFFSLSTSFIFFCKECHHLYSWVFHSSPAFQRLHTLRTMWNCVGCWCAWWVCTVCCSWLLSSCWCWDHDGWTTAQPHPQSITTQGGRMGVCQLRTMSMRLPSLQLSIIPITLLINTYKGGWNDPRPFVAYTTKLLDASTSQIHCLGGERT